MEENVSKLKSKAGSEHVKIWIEFRAGT